MASVAPHLVSLVALATIPEFFGNDAGAYLSQESLGMPRHQMSLSLFDGALRVWNGRGSVAIRDYTVTGLKQPMMAPILQDGDLLDTPVVGPGFGPGGGYWFNLAFRDELSGVLVQDTQDELDMMMLYPDQENDDTAVDCCNKMGDRQSPLVLIHQDTSWQPNHIVRTGHWHKYMANRLTSFSVTSITSMSAEDNTVYLQVHLRNRLPRVLNLTVVPDHHGVPRRPGQFFRDLGKGVEVVSVSDIAPASKDGWMLVVPGNSSTSFNVALSIHCVKPPCERSTRSLAKRRGSFPSSKYSDRHIPHPPGFFMANLSAYVQAAQNATQQRLKWAADQLPKVHTSRDDRALDDLYRRSVLSVVQCRMNNSAFPTNPFYELGNSYGESNSWDLSFSAALLAQLEPAALKGMILRFFTNDILQHAYLDGVTGSGGGFYIYGPFAALQLVQDYMEVTGDSSCLDWRVTNSSGYSESVLEQLKRIALEMNRTYARSEDGLFDIGPGTGKALEIRSSGYEYVIAEITALASDYTTTVALWCKTHGNYSDAKLLFKLADAQANSLRLLWNEDAGWYDNMYPDGSRHTVLSYKMLNMLRSRSAVPNRNKKMMAARLIEGEFLAPYGMYSISRSDDLHWDREDCDWGGGGMFAGFPGQVAETLFRLANTSLAMKEYALKGWELIGRMTRWVQRFPYFPQTFYGDNLMLQPHERPWFLQVSSGAAAQAIIAGVFGLHPRADSGILEIAPPSYNVSILGSSANLTGYRFMGHSFDVLMSMPLGLHLGAFSVRLDGVAVARASFGSRILCHKVTEDPSAPPPTCHTDVFDEQPPAYSV